MVSQSLVDSLALIMHAIQETNARRKESMKPELHADYKDLCALSTLSSDGLLFGKNLQEQVKEINDTNRVTNQKYNQQIGRIDIPLTMQDPNKGVSHGVMQAFLAKCPPPYAASRGRGT